MEEEAILLKKAKRGDLAAFEALVQLYKNKIYGLALRMTGDAEDAFDVAQESVLKLYRALPKFRQKSSFATWVYRIARNASLDFLRKKRASLSLEAMYEQGIEPFAAENIEERVILMDENRALEQLIEELPAQLREVILLRDVDGYSYEQIAQMLQTTLGTVKSRLYRARETLRKKWKENGENDG
ncbi:MAG: sigma-70 family RNA polymerase sigma factor [Clostridiales bacterium]|nr:sigma-70 family RNA polymerase sigma factor [Clostridiales bacterium]